MFDHIEEDARRYAGRFCSRFGPAAVSLVATPERGSGSGLTLTFKSMAPGAASVFITVTNGSPMVVLGLDDATVPLDPPPLVLEWMADSEHYAPPWWDEQVGPTLIEISAGRLSVKCQYWRGRVIRSETLLGEPGVAQPMKSAYGSLPLFLPLWSWADPQALKTRTVQYAPWSPTGA